MTTLYGISNCDTVKRARRRLDEAGITYRYHDFRKDGLQADTVERWLAQLARDQLINRRGTTWRKLAPEQQQLSSDAQAITLMVDYPSLIKRPVIEHGSRLRVGFAKADEAEILAWLAEPAAR